MCLCIYFRKTESMSGRGRGKGRENFKQTLRWAQSPMRGSISQSWDRDLSRNQESMLNSLCYPGALIMKCFKYRLDLLGCPLSDSFIFSRIEKGPHHYQSKFFYYEVLTVRFLCCLFFCCGGLNPCCSLESPGESFTKYRYLGSTSNFWFNSDSRWNMGMCVCAPTRVCVCV